MTPKQIAAEYLQKVWVERDLEALDRYIAPDLIQHNPNLPNGAEPLKTFLGKFFRELMPNIEWRVLRLIAEDDFVVAHSHAIPNPGSPGMVVVDIYRVADGKIIEHWDLTHEVPTTTASGNTIY